jgi:hypothetical protein
MGTSRVTCSQMIGRHRLDLLHEFASPEVRDQRGRLAYQLSVSPSS